MNYNITYIAYASASDICGDGTKATVACDDGNFADGDGCSGTCTVESGYICDGASPTTCSLCGNGVKEGAKA
jgi:large repetitive protein